MPSSIAESFLRTDAKIQKFRRDGQHFSLEQGRVWAVSMIAGSYLSAMMVIDHGFYGRDAISALFKVLEKGADVSIVLFHEQVKLGEKPVENNAELLGLKQRFPEKLHLFSTQWCPKQRCIIVDRRRVYVEDAEGKVVTHRLNSQSFAKRLTALFKEYVCKMCEEL